MYKFVVKYEVKVGEPVEYQSQVYSQYIDALRASVAFIRGLGFCRIISRDFLKV